CYSRGRVRRRLRRTTVGSIDLGRTDAVVVRDRTLVRHRESCAGSWRLDQRARTYGGGRNAVRGFRIRSGAGVAGERPAGFRRATLEVRRAPLGELRSGDPGRAGTDLLACRL